MAEKESPRVITLYPHPDEPELLEFFSTLGMCISSWAFVDRRLYEIFHQAFGSNDKTQTGLLYYRLKNFNGRLRLADDTVRARISKEDYSTHWKPQHDKAFALSHTRNILAHQPVKRVGVAAKDGTRARYIYSIFIEPYEHVLNNDYPGLRGKSQLHVEDLKEHDQAVEVLEHDLRWFLRAILRGDSST